jgi:hypothetical protein
MEKGLTGFKHLLLRNLEGIVRQIITDFKQND